MTRIEERSWGWEVYDDKTSELLGSLKRESGWTWELVRELEKVADAAAAVAAATAVKALEED
jgi:hypothetical protein